MRTKGFRRWVCFIATIFPMAYGCATQAPQMGSLRLKTDDYKRLIERQMAEAGVEEKAVETPPQITAAEHERLGDAEFLQGNIESAFVHYDKALRQDAESPSLYLKQGKILLAKERNREAADAFQEALRRKPDHAEALEGLGMAQYRLGDIDAGEASFQQALRLDPNLWRTYAFLGVIRNHQGQPRLALEAFSAAIRLRPGEGFLYNNLGISYALMGDHDQAVAAFRKALDTGTTDPKVYNNLGLALAKLGRYDEAWQAFALGGGEAEAYNNLGCVLLYRGEHEKARRSFEKALDTSPTFYPRAAQNLESAQRALKTSVSQDLPIQPESGSNTPSEDNQPDETPEGATASLTVAEEMAEGNAEKAPASPATEEPPAEPEKRRDEAKLEAKAMSGGSPEGDASTSIKGGSESAPAVKAIGENLQDEKKPGQEETPTPSNAVTAEVVASRPEFPRGQGAYTVQVATFSEKTAAEQYMAELKRQSLNAFEWETYLPNQGSWHRICIGNFNTLLEAQGVARDLRERGLEANVAKLPGRGGPVSGF